MPVYNSERFVAEAIESILRQTFSDFEFLIVDDYSTDGSLAIIQDYADRDARIRVSVHPENRGDATARNTGIKQAAGKYIALMDHDDVSLPQRLEKQVTYLEAHPEVGAVGVFHRQCDEDLTPRLTHPLPTRHYAIVLNMILFTTTVLKNPAMMLRRELLDSWPVFDPEIVPGAELGLYLRLLWEKGIRFANVPEHLFLYRRHANTQVQRHRTTIRRNELRMRSQALQRLGKPGEGVEWIVHKHPLDKLSWKERRRARRDISSLIEAMVDHNWVDADDEPLLHDEMNQLLESTTPRYWQMFLHWYRYRIARRVQA